MIYQSDIYSELPELNEYQDVRDKIFKFVDTIDDGYISRFIREFTT